MFELLGISSQALFGQLLIGLINGSFYALLSLGLAVIFGMLNIINFTHGAQYMLGAFAAYFLLLYAGLGYWWAIIITSTDCCSPLVSRSFSRARSATFSAPRGCPIPCRRRCKAARISGSCFYRTTAP